MRRRSEDSKREDAALTRERLVEAGVHVFARQTYEEASVREIAARAGVTVAMVGYHFKGKAGLYLAVADRIVEAGLGIVGPALDHAYRALSADPPDRAAARDAVQGLLRVLLETSREDHTFDWARIMLREQLDASSAGDVLHEKLTQPYMTLLANLLAIVAGRPVERRDMVQAFALMGQMIVFRATRDAASRLLGPPDAANNDFAVMMELVDRQLGA